MHNLKVGDQVALTPDRKPLIESKKSLKKLLESISLDKDELQEDALSKLKGRRFEYKGDTYIVTNVAFNGMTCGIRNESTGEVSRVKTTGVLSLLK